MIITDNDVVDLSTPTGPMRTSVFRPVAKGRYPGLVLYSEIFQVTGPIRRIAAVLAGHGLVVAVPEIYHELEPPGTVLAYDEADAKRGNQHKITKVLSSYDSDARAVLDYLTTCPHCTGKLGVIGVCLGGHLAFRAAMNRDVLAGACFYATDIHIRGLGEGKHDDTLDRMGEIQGEMLMIWGRQDPHIPKEGRALIYHAMTEQGVHFQWHEFNNAHAFMRDEGPRYDPAGAQIGYSLVLELFKRKLGEGDRSP
ncbi:MAG: dienelactone hydrolase family protein [Nitrospinae bacterium]|nr:dienelactone hydrolase family protein [Nitrospinota bacterium]